MHPRNLLCDSFIRKDVDSGPYNLPSISRMLFAIRIAGTESMTRLLSLIVTP